ncbi:MAG TPA: VOC family protein [Acidimicrobiia bacterium]
MTARATAPLGAPCWVDLLTSDQEASKQFYGEIFGWTVDDPGPEFGGYVNFLRDGVQVGGCMRNDGTSAQPDVWSVYLAVDDAQANVDRAAAHRGQTHLPPMPVADLGVMAMVADAGGAAIGLWQPGLHKGFGVYGESGTPSWFELHTRAYDASLEFYRDVFAWNLELTADTPEFRYALLEIDGEALAGVIDASSFLPEGVPPHWAVYFGVDDADATLERVEKLGGAVVQRAEDTPYGRLAAAVDSTGAGFRLLQPLTNAG